MRERISETSVCMDFQKQFGQIDRRQKTCDLQAQLDQAWRFLQLVKVSDGQRWGVIDGFNPHGIICGKVRFGVFIGIIEG